MHEHSTITCIIFVAYQIVVCLEALHTENAATLLFVVEKLFGSAAWDQELRRFSISTTVARSIIQYRSY